ncbi:P-type conjugative transfer protein TrbJ [Henriciella aquimarina]|uniref:P-type conjugative transfer protein TrbJ n=1 Tax=Henriciella aquimarina TaxID=545261 RepID=UPI0009FC6713|nr:P-type conjugative transfer protein TrbJ [Henriciella aquimarina]
MKRLLASLALIAAPAVFPLPANAQFSGGVVYDPTNHAQNVLQAVRALQQVEQQVQQLAHEVEMLENMARNLETLPANVAETIIRNRINRIHALMSEAEGIGYGVAEIERDYETAYPEDFGETPPPNAVLVGQSRARWRQSRSAYRDTLVTVATALEDNETDADAIAGLVSRSQTAAGALQAAQAGNQIEAIQAEQLIQMEAMMAAHYRADALERARALAEAERGRARTKAFLED